MESAKLFDMIILILIIILIIIGFISNVVVVIVYLSTKMNHSYTNYFFVNLSIADILFTINSLPILVNDSIFYFEFGDFGEWHLGSVFCKFIFIFKFIFILHYDRRYLVSPRTAFLQFEDHLYRLKNPYSRFNNKMMLC